jgi:hypothetical protein
MTYIVLAYFSMTCLRLLLWQEVQGFTIPCWFLGVVHVVDPFGRASLKVREVIFVAENDSLR